MVRWRRVLGGTRNCATAWLRISSENVVGITAINGTISAWYGTTEVPTGKSLVVVANANTGHVLNIALTQSPPPSLVELGPVVASTTN